MQPMKTKQIIGYNKNNRRSLNQILEDHKPSTIDNIDTVEANRIFDKINNEKFNIALTVLD